MTDPILNRNFSIVWLGQSISWLGGWTQSVAQGWLVWSLTHSPAQLALTAMAMSSPALLFSLLGGAVADRVDKRSLLVRTQTASIIPALLLGTLTACGRITPTLVLVLAFHQGVLNAFEVPARHSFLSELVPRCDLRRAVVLNAVSFNATRMLGPALAGCVIAAYGTAPCFFLNAFSFLAGIAALRCVKPVEKGADRVEEKPALALRELREGFCYVLQEKEIRSALLLVAAVSLFGIPFLPLLPVFAETLRVGGKGLGMMSACAGSGSLLAAAALALAGELRERKGGAAAAGTLFAVALLIFSRSENYRLSLLSLFAAGAGVVIFLAQVNSFIQQRCPDRLRGRVMGAYTFALLGCAPLGSALMGSLAATLGAAGALSVSASICLATIAALSLVPAPLRRRRPLPASS